MADGNNEDHQLVVVDFVDDVASANADAPGRTAGQLPAARRSRLVTK
jgi:hypothetical protein